MKVVALLSGGKDSIYNVMKCVHYGHEIVCIGNLRPAPADVDELDSEMYQSVGWNGVELIAKAMDLPFYYGLTYGKSKQSTLTYNHSQLDTHDHDNNDDDENKTDEVEDLLNLLIRIKAKHPAINAVSTGAILSNYQRNRVESVCQRLQLVNLSYLWQRTDQQVLLQEMIDNDIDAIIIKCASMGLIPDEFLGRSIKEEAIYDKLAELGTLYGMNVCGEGGEYETFVLDCPLFHKFKISIDESSICGDLNDPISPNGYLSFKKLSLIPKLKQSENGNVSEHKDELKNAEVTKTEDSARSHWQPLKVNAFVPWTKPNIIDTTNVCNYGAKNGIFQFVAHPNVSINSKYIQSLDLKTEIDLLFKALQQQLTKHELSIDNLFYCQLFLNDMQLFAEVNAIYKSYLKNLFPPSRVCCQLDLINQHRVSLEALAYKFKYSTVNGIEMNKDVYQCLHVQSVSEWAPNCIGPYSQATKISNKFIFAAGVIGLVPATMQMVPNQQAVQQIDQTWKNLNAVLSVFDSNLALGFHHNIFVLAAPQKERKFDASMVQYEYDYANDDIDDDNIESDDELKNNQVEQPPKDDSNKEDVAEVEEKMASSSKQMDSYLYQTVQNSVQKHIVNGDRKNNEEQTENPLHFNAVIIYVPDLPKHALMEVQTLSLTKTCLNNLSAAKSMPYSMSSKSQQNKMILPETNPVNKRKVKLKYAHIKRKKKKPQKTDIFAVCTEERRNEIGNFFIIKTKSVYNLHDKWCSVVSICELSSPQNGGAIAKLIKSALAQSALYINGYGHIIEKNASTEWTETSIVFLRLYYESEALDPKPLLKNLEDCFRDLNLAHIPAISLVPCRGVCFVEKDAPQKFGLYMLHCFLYQQ